MLGTNESENGGQYLEALAIKAYDFCVASYGPPLDPDRPYRIYRDRPRSMCGYASLLGHYIIEVDERCIGREQLAATIGHEMSHRVFFGRPLIAKYLWIDEMFAFLASDALLRDWSHVSYADERIRALRRQPQRLSIRRLQKVRRPWAIALPGSLRGYPPGFTPSVALIGLDLVEAAGWDAICRLASSGSVEAWISTLPSKHAARVSTVAAIA